MSISGISSDSWINYASASKESLFSGIANQRSSGIDESADQASAEDIFAQSETGKDGSISETEFQETEGLLELLNASSQMMAFSVQNTDYSGMANAVISDEDSDGDGSLSISETDMTEERFSAVDSNGDGVLSAEEIAEDIEAQSQAAQSGPPPPPPPSEEEDSDDDEDSSSSTSGISEYDLNEDGVVSMEELLEALFGETSSEEEESNESVMDQLFGDSSESDESELSQQASQVEEMRMVLNGNMSVMSQLLSTQSAAA